jgi:hypothetical protein
MMRCPYDPDAQRVIKISFDARHLWVPQGQGILRRGFRTLNRFFSAFGLAGRVEVFQRLAVGAARSCHFEVESPPGMNLAETVLRIRPSSSQRYIQVDKDDAPYRGHVRASDRGRNDLGELSVIFYANRQGLVLPLLLVGIIISGAVYFIPGRYGAVDGAALGAVLLLPFLLAAYYARSDEHSYVTSTLQGTRLLALITVGCGVAVVLLAALGYLHEEGAQPGTTVIQQVTVPDIVHYAEVLSISSTAIMALSLVMPWAGRVYRSAVRRWQRTNSGDRGVLKA